MSPVLLGERITDRLENLSHRGIRSYRVAVLEAVFWSPPAVGSL